MYYEIVVTDPKAPRTTKQKLSPFYSEAPSVGGKTLRRGSPLKMSIEGFKHLDLQLRRFLDAGAVEIWRVHPDGKREPVRSIGTVHEEVEKLRDEVKALDAVIRPEKPAVIAPPPPPAPEVIEAQEPTQEAQEPAAEEPVTAVTAPAEETPTEPVQEMDETGTVDEARKFKKRRKG